MSAIAQGYFSLHFPINDKSSKTGCSLGIETVKLIIEPESTATTKAVEIVNIARQQILDVTTIREIIQLIETILIYKLPRLTQEEIGKMFGSNELKQTRFYQDVFAEGRQEGKQEGREEGRQEGRQEGKQEGRQEAKLETIPQLLGLGLSIEQIAQALGLDEQVVRQAAQPKS